MDELIKALNERTIADDILEAGKKKDDGGPAFPHTMGDPHDIWSGMSLRDCFAGAAMMAINWENTASLEEAAKDCFEFADAMIAERKK